jgi:glutamyl-tRNA synthetase
MMPLDEFIERAGEELPAEWDRTRFAAIAPHIQERLTTLNEVPDKVDFLFWPTDAPIEYDPASWDKAFGADWAVPLLRDVIDAYGDVTWAAHDLKAALEAAMERHSIKLGKAQAPVRVAVTGRAVGPPLFESIEVLGRDETLRRLVLAVDAAGASGGGG